MPIPLKKIRWVEFKQKEITIRREKKIELFEFISPLYESEQLVDDQLYCQLLLNKIFQLNVNIITKFLHYHCSQFIVPIEWLTSLDFLLVKNIELLFEIGFELKLNKMLNLVEKEIIGYSLGIPNSSIEKGTSTSEIQKIKSHIESLSSFFDKTAYLHRMKTDYLQNPISLNKSELTLDKQIDLELAYLKTELKLQKEKFLHPNNEKSILIWTGQVNQLVDIFFQCLQIKNEKGQPLIKSRNEKVIQFIVNNFQKIDGSNFSASTIRTILKPGRVDKRPKEDLKIIVNK